MKIKNKIKNIVVSYVIIAILSCIFNLNIYNVDNSFASDGVSISIPAIEDSSLNNELQILNINLNTQSKAIDGVEFTLAYNPSEIEIIQDSTVYSPYFSEYIKSFKNGSIDIIALRNAGDHGLIISKDIITFTIKPKVATNKISAYFAKARYIDTDTKEVYDILDKSVNYDIKMDSIQSLSFDFVNNRMNISFEHSMTDVKGFDVYRKDEGSSDFVKINGSYFLNKSYVDINVKNNTKYIYKIKTTSNAYNLTQETVEYGMVTPFGVISSPVVYINEQNKAEISLDVSNINNLSKYYIYRSEDDISYEEIAKVDIGQVYVDESIIESKSYYYKVKVLSTVDNALSEYSIPVNIIARFGSFNGNSISMINDVPVLSWPAQADTIGYEIYRSDNKGMYKNIQTVNDNKFTDDTIKDRMYYRYYVRGISSIDGTLGDPSNEAILETKLTKLNMLQLKNNENTSVGITYDPVDTFTPNMYKIYRMKNMSNNKIVYSGSNVAFNDIDIQDNNIYYYSVSYISPFTEKESEISDINSLIITSNEIVQNINTTNVTSDSITLQWGLPSVSISKYKVYRSLYMNDRYQVFDTPNNAFTDIALNPNTTYYYKFSFVSESTQEESKLTSPIFVTTKLISSGNSSRNDNNNTISTNPDNPINPKDPNNPNNDNNQDPNQPQNNNQRDVFNTSNNSIYNNSTTTTTDNKSMFGYTNLDTNGILDSLGCYNTLKGKDLLSVQNIKAWLHTDSDKDGIPNVTEIKNNTELFSYNNKEIKYNLDMMNDMIHIDDNIDADMDKVNDRLENFLGINSSSKDSDGDKIDDITEILCTMTNPINKEQDLEKLKKGNIDSDGDGLSDELEYIYGTDPYNPDSDGDGYTDGEEVLTYKTNPLDKKSNPKTKKVKEVVNAIDNEIKTNDTSPLIQGMSTPDTMVNIIAKDKNGKEIQLGNVITDENGNFILDSDIDLENGDYEIIFKEIIDGKEVIYRIKTKLIVNSEFEIPRPIVKYIDDQFVLDKLSDTGAVVKIETFKPLVRGNTYFGSKVFASWQSTIYNSAMLADSQFGYFEIRPPKSLDIGSHVVTLYAVTSDGYQSKSVKLRLLIENDKIKSIEEIKDDNKIIDNNNPIDDITKYLQNNIFNQGSISMINILYVVGFILILGLIILGCYLGYKKYKTRQSKNT